LAEAFCASQARPLAVSRYCCGRCWGGGTKDLDELEDLGAKNGFDLFFWGDYFLYVESISTILN
jgi:hypothetical protein